MSDRGTLARIGSPAAVSELAARYPKEGEDCRWYTLKAMDYIGTPEAMSLVKEKGLQDKETFCRALAERLALR